MHLLELECDAVSFLIHYGARSIRCGERACVEPLGRNDLDVRVHASQTQIFIILIVHLVVKIRPHLLALRGGLVDVLLPADAVEVLLAVAQLVYYDITIYIFCCIIAQRAFCRVFLGGDEEGHVTAADVDVEEVVEVGLIEEVLLALPVDDGEPDLVDLAVLNIVGDQTLVARVVWRLEVDDQVAAVLHVAEVNRLVSNLSHYEW